MSALLILSAAVLVSQADAAFADLAETEAAPATQATDEAVPAAPVAAEKPAAPTDTPAVQEPRPRPTVNAARPVAVAAPPGARRWRLLFDLGVAYPSANSAAWFRGAGEPVSALRLERDVERLLPGLALGLGAAAWGSGESGTDSAALTLQVFELAASGTYALPQDGLWGFLFPYGRVAVLADYWQVHAGDTLGDNVFAPGLAVGLGLRLHMGRAGALVGGGSVPVRMFGTLEGGYALRFPAEVQLHRKDANGQDRLPGPETALGRLRLSGFEWSMGIGISF